MAHNVMPLDIGELTIHTRSSRNFLRVPIAVLSSETSPIIISQASETPLANIHQPATRRTAPRSNAHPNLIWQNRLVAHSGRGKDNCPSLPQIPPLLSKIPPQIDFDARASPI
ncbi:hypothetical protein BDP81DRAFT_431933 [Colletotrichum phormii]|uniref:Uncharacterized protein n=1 Tax=Colletotrichum phormii TaxID=359342 RepID=A0AAI9ZMK0_9PEZI|nr:uncharacterized protein BDP81DRAFT_431933 [Colletotrichum phormii]KAK1634756.1 hypothetical protein BDP81DRAFT_431933 [Colletotrichum phormii]